MSTARHGLRSKSQLYVMASIFSFAYLAAAVFFLSEAEQPGDDENILLLLAGGVVFWFAGMIVGRLLVRTSKSGRHNASRR